MKNPVKLLDAFEDRQGDYYTLLDKYINATDEREKKKYNGLLRKHTKLVWYVMGYYEGIKEAQKKEGSN